MDKKINGHTAAFIKRKAKNIKKTQQVPHVQALDLAALSVGFANWKDFIYKSEAVTKTEPRWADKIINTKAGGKITKLDLDRKINPYRKLLIAGTNELLKGCLITLNGKEGKYPHEDNGHVFLDLFGFPSVVLWSDISFEELRISVWWKYNHALHPQANLTGNSRESFSMSSPLASRLLYKNFVGVTVSAWLERRTGKHLQGSNQECLFDLYTRKGEKQALEKLPYPAPNGFFAEGKFFM
jgi:hypothetical protein